MTCYARAAAAALLLAALAAGCGGAPEKDPAPPVTPRAAALLVRAQQALEAQDPGRALVLADSAEAAARPDETRFLADVNFLRGLILTDINDLERAAAAYERVLTLDPKYRGARLNLGNVAFRQGRYAPAIMRYRQEYDAFPDPRLQIRIGRAYTELGKPDSARAAFEQALREDEGLAEAYALLAYLYDAEADFEQATVHARRAVALDGANPDYRYMLGMLLLRTGRNEEARRNFTSVVAEQPFRHEAHYNLGQALMRLGLSEEATQHLKDAERLRQQERDLFQWENLSRLYPRRPAIWATLGYAYRQAGRTADALHAYRVAHLLEPNDRDIQLEIANLLLAGNAYEEALGGYLALLRQDSTDPAVWINTGILYARTGRPAAARSAWKTALRHDPANETARSYLKQMAELPSVSVR